MQRYIIFVFNILFPKLGMLPLSPHTWRKHFRYAVDDAIVNYQLLIVNCCPIILSTAPRFSCTKVRQMSQTAPYCSGWVLNCRIRDVISSAVCIEKAPPRLTSSTASLNLLYLGPKKRGTPNTPASRMLCKPLPNAPPMYDKSLYL